ncbi:MAG: ABC transporter ATP-binding protein [Ardenticatenales bacterium]|nr:ABC transporter ATP-binding protein [Ardenticatenales bacterium]
MNQVRLLKHLPRTTLDLDFTFGQETIALFGPSGAGKSLTLQAIAGLLRPDSGRIVINGTLLYDGEQNVALPPQARRIGYVMQDFALFPHLSVAENIVFGLDGLPRREQQARLAEMVSLLRLEGLEGRRPRQLSGGQQQRVALARALIIRPSLLLLDEPFAALDTPMRARLRRELLTVQRQLQLPTILVTHDLAEAHMLAERIAVLDEGRLLQIGAPAEVLRRPAALNVARFTGARNIFLGRLQRDESGWQMISRRATLPLRLPSEGSVYHDGILAQCMVRPEHITLVRPGEEPRRAGRRETLLQGTIVEELDHGLSHSLFFHLDNAGGTGPEHVDLEVELSHRSYELLGVVQRRQWTLAIKEEDVHLIGPAIPPHFEGPAPQPLPSILE